MLMMTGARSFCGTPPTRKGLLSEPAVCRGAEDQAPRSASTETGLLQLTVDAVGELVEPFIDADLLCNHLLQGSRPLRRQIEEQGLRSEVDLCARRRDVMLLQIAGI